MNPLDSRRDFLAAGIGAAAWALTPACAQTQDFTGLTPVTYFGPVHNPWALDRISGGSSGGSAAAIAAGLCSGTLGTDTGGSIRIPSSDCGVVGFMPSYGRVSNRGVIPMAWTLDHAGPRARLRASDGLAQSAAGFENGVREGGGL
jgi:hypothetical protein